MRLPFIKREIPFDEKSQVEKQLRVTFKNKLLKITTMATKRKAATKKKTAKKAAPKRKAAKRTTKKRK